MENAPIQPDDLPLTDLVSSHTEHLSDWESGFCNDLLRRCSFGGEISRKQGIIVFRIQTKVAKILNIKNGTIVEAPASRPTVSESEQVALDGLQDALTNHRVQKKSIEFATDLIRKAKKYGLSEKQMYWVRKLGGVTAATVASIPTNPEIEALRPLVQHLPSRNTKFAGDLINNYDLSGSLSRNQWRWVEKMTIIGEEVVRTALREDADVVKDYTAVVELFDRTSETLKHPKIHLQVQEGEGEGREAGWSAYNRELVIRTKRRQDEDADIIYVEEVERSVQTDSMTRVYPKTANERGVTITGEFNLNVPGYGPVGRDYNDTDHDIVEVPRGMFGTHRIIHYYVREELSGKGRSTTNGKPESMGQIERTPAIFRPRNHTPDDVLIVMESFRTDPLGTIVRLGKSTGRCSFCNSPLSDRRSRAHGYGPVCAKHYSLAWTHDHADEVEAGIEESVGRQVMELRPGVWSVVDLDTNEVIVTYDTYEQAQADLDEWSRLERVFTDGGEA
jgi:hypothetical protein